MKWNCIYIPGNDSQAVAETLQNVLQLLGYKPYDPFPGGLGTPPELKSFVKLFVTPAQDGWVRVLGELNSDLDIPKALSRTISPVLYGWLTDTESALEDWDRGERNDPQGLSRFLVPDKTFSHLERALNGLMPVSLEKKSTVDPQVVVLPSEMVQMMSDHNVKPEQASNMISRLTSQLFSKMDKGSEGEASRMKEQAHSMLAKAQGVDWNSPAGQKLRTIAGLLSLPANWREPDFDTVREAYQVARRLKRNPNAQLMPDEQAAINALADAINYQPVYMGK